MDGRTLGVLENNGPSLIANYLFGKNLATSRPFWPHVLSVSETVGNHATVHFMSVLVSQVGKAYVVFNLTWTEMRLSIVTTQMRPDLRGDQN